VFIWSGLQKNVQILGILTYFSILAQQINSASLDGTSRFIGGLLDSYGDSWVLRMGGIKLMIILIYHIYLPILPL